MDKLYYLWGDYPVFDVLNYYALMQLLKVLRVIFRWIHFCVFLLEKLLLLYTDV